MPLVSEFYGIKIYMYWSEHTPPHFHAEYAGQKALIDIENSVIMKGVLPFKQAKLVLAWCELHKNELTVNWESAKLHKEIKHIEPLK
jgi:hypothetical protein